MANEGYCKMYVLVRSFVYINGTLSECSLLLCIQCMHYTYFDTVFTRKEEEVYSNFHICKVKGHFLFEFGIHFSEFYILTGCHF